MKGKYKRKKIWCSTCDAEIVEVGTKCSNCGCREHASKIKKPKITPDYSALLKPIAEWEKDKQ